MRRKWLEDPVPPRHLPSIRVPSIRYRVPSQEAGNALVTLGLHNSDVAKASENLFYVSAPRRRPLPARAMRAVAAREFFIDTWVVNETSNKIWGVQTGFRKGMGCMDQVFLCEILLRGFWPRAKRGVIQGCVASPWLFNLFIDGRLHNLKEYECGLGMDELTVKCLLNADDRVIPDPLACELQMKRPDLSLRAPHSSDIKESSFDELGLCREIN
ncbi:hypothetical protein EVAR_81756_1 [Eumeta japonica]|uniref:Reverse transcriptase domain-containing protein n=1 Tax=Eumeta variegata TaxID=151549 RepID=A0A4C1UHI6_EUMVA|nr:hypothetical protein EVAR_81756_1 [Eumeta japonica]